MDQELKALLVEMERNLAGQIAELRADVKADMTGMKADVLELKGDVVGLKAGMAAMKQELLDHSEAVETRLVTEFWK